MAEKTNLPADLPENWTPGQIVSPDGVSAGLTEKHGYNYLMKQVNDAQKSVSSTSASLESHDQDSESHKDIRTSLNSKVDKITGKALSTNDYTTAEKNLVAGISGKVNKAGDKMSGLLKAPAVHLCTVGNQLRFTSEDNSKGYGVFFRHSGSALYIMTTNLNDALGTWNELRPFTIDLATGNVALGGSPTAPTKTAGDRTTSVATTAFVQNGLDGKVSTSMTSLSDPAYKNFDSLPDGFYRVNGSLTKSPIPYFNGEVRTMTYAAYKIQVAYEYSGLGATVTGMYIRDWGARSGVSSWSPWVRVMMTPMAKAFSAPVEALYEATDEVFTAQERIMEAIVSQGQKISELEQEIIALKKGE